MTDVRTDILHRIRTALTDRATPAPVARTYRGAGEVHDPDLVAVLAARLREYQATVEIATPDAVPGAVAAAFGEHGVRDVAVPIDLPEALLRELDLRVLRDEPALATTALDAVDAVLTGCALAIADTGTIVLDHGIGQGRRLLTLIPDQHVVVVRPDQIVARVPDAIAALAAAPLQTWISGPSATSDIELDRVEGVHGPRRLHVIIG